jgi:hypothetical protein
VFRQAWLLIKSQGDAVKFLAGAVFALVAVWLEDRLNDDRQTEQNAQTYFAAFNDGYLGAMQDRLFAFAAAVAQPPEIMTDDEFDAWLIREIRSDTEAYTAFIALTRSFGHADVCVTNGTCAESLRGLLQPLAADFYEFFYPVLQDLECNRNVGSGPEAAVLAFAATERRISAVCAEA